MEVNELFLARCEEMRVLVANPRAELDLLNLSSCIYQMIIDQPRLIDAVNLHRRKIQFEVATPSGAFAGIPGVIETYFDISLAERMRPDAIKKLNRDQFLAYNVIEHSRRNITVRELVEHAREVAGGVHFGQPAREKHRKVEDFVNRELAKRWPFLTFRVELMALQSIARVVLRAVEPLRLEVSAQRAITPPTPAP